jgi:hypothetical protein
LRRGKADGHACTSSCGLAFFVSPAKAVASVAAVVTLFALKAWGI